MKTLTSAEFAQELQSSRLMRPGVDEAVDVHLTDDEVDEWMRLFGGEKKPKRPRK